METALQAAPQDILSEIGFFAGGGGDPADCTDNVTRPRTWDSNQERWTATAESVEEIQFAGLERMEATIGAYTCGWRADENVTVTVKFPDGREISQTAHVFENIEPSGKLGGNSAGYNYRPELTDPLGKYTLIFKGNSGTTTHTVLVLPSTEPKLYYLFESNHLLLLGFSPYERVRVFAYQGDRFNTGLLVAWQEFQVDSDGQLLIVNHLPDQLSLDSHLMYSATGEVSGEVTNSFFTIRGQDSQE